MSGDLASWLLGQIAVDERKAQQASSDRIGNALYMSMACFSEDILFAARLGPDYVLADLAVKRRLVETYQREAVPPDPLLSYDANPSYDDGYVDGLAEAVAILGTLYADRPGYAQSWGP